MRKTLQHMIGVAALTLLVSWSSTGCTMEKKCFDTKIKYDDHADMGDKATQFCHREGFHTVASSWGRNGYITSICCERVRLF